LRFIHFGSFSFMVRKSTSARPGTHTGVFADFRPACRDKGAELRVRRPSGAVTPVPRGHRFRVAACSCLQSNCTGDKVPFPAIMDGNGVLGNSGARGIPDRTPRIAAREVNPVCCRS
jgi:hypothetical protein